jgi:hypothetical protein
VRKEKPLRAFLGIAGIVACAFVSAPAAAQFDAQRASAFVVAQPALGTSFLSAQSYSELMVHVEWAGSDDATISVEAPYGQTTPIAETKVRLGHPVTVILPVDTSSRYSSDLSVIVRDHRGVELGRAHASTVAKDAPIVVALDEHSDVATRLNGERIEFVAPLSYSNNKTVKQISVVHPPTADGRIQPPEHAMGYHDAALVLTKDTTLDALAPAPRAALLEWVKLGGHLAIESTSHDAARDVQRVVGGTVPFGGGTVYAFAPGEDSASARGVSDEVRRASESRDTSFVDDPSANGYQFDQMRRALDPNENFRPALGMAALVLIFYSIVIGPVLYRRARKRKKPLELLYTLPLASAAAFVLILGLGVFTKGLHGRSRRLTFVDLTSGEAEGSARTFRAFYSNRSSSFDIAASGPGALPRLAHTGLSGEGEETVRLEGDTATLANVTLPPWQTAIVIEDGKSSIDGAITIDYTNVDNRSPYSLRNVFVQRADGSCNYFATIPANSKVAIGTGSSVWNGCMSGGSYSARQISVYQVGSSVPHDQSQDFNDIWNAIVAQAPQTDLVPSGETVLFAEVEGKKAPSFDSGLYVDKSRTLVRVRASGGH